MPHLYNRNLNSYARQNRQAGILAEVIMWNNLKKSALGVKFTKQKPIGNYIADFYSKECNLVIEVDGCSHDNKFEYDAARDAYMAEMGITVLRFSDTDVLRNMDGVLNIIRGNITITPHTGGEEKICKGC